MTINVDELHNIVATDRVTLSQVEQKINQDASGRNCDNQSSPEHDSTLKKLLTVEPIMEKQASTRPKNEGLLPTAEKNEVRPELREKRPPTCRETLNQATENIDARVVDSVKYGQRTLYRVRWFRYSPSDDPWKPADHFSQQFIALYMWCSSRTRWKTQQWRIHKKTLAFKQYKHPSEEKNKDNEHSVWKPVTVLETIWTANKTKWRAYTQLLKSPSPRSTTASISWMSLRQEPFPNLSRS